MILSPEISDPSTLKPIYVMYVNINIDGIGDYTHFEDIMRRLINDPRYMDVEFVPIICFNSYGKQINYYRINDKLEILFAGKIKYYYTKSNNFGALELNPYIGSEIYKKLKSAQQVIFISYESNYEFSKHYEDILSKDILCKYIGEHEADEVQALKSHPISYRNLGLYDNHFGIKCDYSPKIERTQALSIINEQAPQFTHALLTQSQTSELQMFDEQNITIPCYFNNLEDFFAYLRFISTNKHLPKDKNIFIYFSGTNLKVWQDPDVEKLYKEEGGAKQQYTFDCLLDELKSSDIKQIDIITNDGQAFTLAGNDSATKIIRIFSGFYLEDETYNALYSIAFMAGVSGDNSFEKCVSMSILPYYFSTNFCFKRLTVNALKLIAEKPDLEISPEVRKDFCEYFNTKNMEIHHGDYRNSVVDTKNINLLAMVEAWPIIAQYIRENYNFYDQLDAIMCENLPTQALPAYFREHKIDAPITIAPNIYLSFLSIPDCLPYKKLGAIKKQTDFSVKKIMWSMCSMHEKIRILSVSNYEKVICELVDEAQFVILNKKNKITILKQISYEKRQLFFQILDPAAQAEVIAIDKSRELKDIYHLMHEETLAILGSQKEKIITAQKMVSIENTSIKQTLNPNSPVIEEISQEASDAKQAVYPANVTSASAYSALVNGFFPLPQNPDAKESSSMSKSKVNLKT